MPTVKKNITKSTPKTVKTTTAKKTAVVKTVPVQEVKPTEKKVVTFVNKNINISPRKLRLLANSIKKLAPAEALSSLQFVTAKSARVLITALKNVLADAKNNFSLDQNSLKFDTIRVDESIKIKRMDKSHGSRFARGLIQKRHSRLTIKVIGSVK